jgi:hypothetical protein
MPSAPMMMNIVRQPKIRRSAVRMGGARAGPMVDEVMKMPIGRPRSCTPNHSLTTFAPAGKLGASPRPSATRATRNCWRLVTKPPHNCAADQTNMPRPSITRAPKRSSSMPIGNCEKA